MSRRYLIIILLLQVMGMLCFNIQARNHSHLQLPHLFKMNSHKLPIVCLLLPQWNSLLLGVNFSQLIQVTNLWSLTAGKLLIWQSI
uniref:Uncharacterized protein n=1 Tax=Arundo donax TaxID=35708 RepID=A0A0A9G9F8_ARUDO